MKTPLGSHVLFNVRNFSNLPSPLNRNSIGPVLVAFWKSAYSDRSGPLEIAMHSAFSSATFSWLAASVYQMMLFLRMTNDSVQFSEVVAVRRVILGGGGHSLPESDIMEGIRRLEQGLLRRARVPLEIEGSVDGIGAVLHEALPHVDGGEEPLDIEAP